MSTGKFFSQPPLGMNGRNYMIRHLNSRQALALARDKVIFKRLLVGCGIPTPRSLAEIHDYTDLSLIPGFPNEFVLKPSRGYAGNGVVLLHRADSGFVNPSGEVFTERDLRRHIRKILDGEFSGYIGSDVAIVEERVYPSPRLKFKDAVGLPDIRVFTFFTRPVLTMMRFGTVKSRGRSNLAKGGIGLGLDMETGRVKYAHSKKEAREFPPSELGVPESFVVPRWSAVKETAIEASRLSGLVMAGVDIVLDERDTVLVLEINGRPGLEIQNINEASLQQALAAFSLR